MRSQFKTTMRFDFTILSVILLMSCNISDRNENEFLKENLKCQVDTTFSNINKSKNDFETDPYDSLAKVFVDTTSLKGKRESIMNTFLIENRPSSPDYDTLFDLTYDGFDDYIIGYYGQSGTGIKNRVKVYFFDIKNNCYVLNEQLSRLPNPTFYIQQKKITGFYIGSGAGGGGQLEWINNKWTTTKEFHVDNEDDSTKWVINYPLKNKSETEIRLYEMIPPQDILETNIKW